MKQFKLLLTLVVLALSAFMIWRIGLQDLEWSFKTSLAQAQPAVRGGAAPPQKEDVPSEANEVDSSAVENPAEKQDKPPSVEAENEATSKPDASPAVADANEADPKPKPAGEQLEALNLKDVEVKNLIDKLATWTNKVIIPDEAVMKLKITIYAPHKVPRKEALNLIYSALRTKGYVAEHTENVIYLKPIDKAKLGQVPTVGHDEHLALFENKEQIVQKFFKMQNYSPSRMGELISPLVGEYGEVSADEITGAVIVIDTVANLIRIQRVISEFDVPEAEQAVSDVIQVHNGDPSEIVQLLRILVGGEAPVKPRSSSSSRSSYSQGIYRFSPSRSSRPSRSTSSASAAMTGKGQVPIVLIPEPRRKWIIARASAQDMGVVKEWVRKLDVAEPVVSETEMIPVVYADAQEVATRIEDALADMPGHELQPSILVRALQQSRQIMIIGRKDLREMVKKLVAEIDIPPGEYETKTFDLKYVDSTQIKENIDSLYGEEGPDSSPYSSSSYYYYRYGPGSRDNSGNMVKVIDFPMMQQVTVICAPVKMRRIEKQIEEWDQPIDVDEVKPRFVEVRNSDPQQIATLLTNLFSEDDNSTNQLFRVFFFGRGGSDSKKKIIGPLYGQLTFEHVPGTKKIIIISKIPEAYDVVIDLVRELDGEEMAEVPTVIPLKYADPEALAERLNALFNESGTNASIRFDSGGLSDMDMDGDQGNNNQNNNNRNQNNNNNNNNNNDPDSYRPWWNEQRLALDEEPISNVIGKVRFIPDTHSKSILVLAPPEFMPNIEKTVHELDIPGKQVLIKAVIVEVDHSSMTSLGVQLSSNPGAFPAVGEPGLLALAQLTELSTSGSATAVPLTTSPLGAVGTGTIAGGTTDVYAMVDFLAKTVDAKILNQQSLWTKDNEEASFFKGDRVPFNAGSTVGTGGFSTQDTTFEPVGMTMQIRPSITPEDRVDMEIRVLLSQLKSETVNGQPIRGEMQTTTKMIVESGETLMMAGILFQKDSNIRRKVPLLGDVPVVGGLFRHKELIQSNNELIVFITPEVIGAKEDGTEKTAELMQQPLEMLGGVEAQMDEMFEPEVVVQDD